MQVQASDLVSENGVLGGWDHDHRLQQVLEEVL